MYAVLGCSGCLYYILVSLTECLLSKIIAQLSLTRSLIWGIIHIRSRKVTCWSLTLRVCSAIVQQYHTEGNKWLFWMIIAVSVIKFQFVKRYNPKKLHQPIRTTGGLYFTLSSSYWGHTRISHERDLSHSSSLHTDLHRSWNFLTNTSNQSLILTTWFCQMWF